MKDLNIVFLGRLEYPKGMAGTKRIQHVINGLRKYSRTSISVVVTRQSCSRNAFNGVHHGIPYWTLTAEGPKIKKLIKTPFVRAKARRKLKDLLQHERSNLLYVYGPPDFDTFPAATYARKIGYKIIFDIVEDDDLKPEILSNFWNLLANKYTRFAIENITFLAHGIIVISSHLEKKYYAITRGKPPIHYLPISIDADIYPEAPHHIGDPVTLFYSGSFGKKDGVPVLIKAFDRLAEKYPTIRLVMTGTGVPEAMRIAFDCIDGSPYKTQIIYKGYLDDSDYYKELLAADIYCMPRIDFEYAHAGFPFKLGEYLATGKPVIASMVSDIPMLLKDRQEAMLVTPGSSDDIVRAVEFILSNPEIAFVIGKHGRELAKRLFDYRRQSDGLLSFMQAIAE
jgi:glycosyltransferase involved in cell wall biosynthesis